MEESSQLVPVLVEPTSTVDLTEIPSRSHQATPSPRGGVDSCAIMSEGTRSSSPRVMESRCLKVTFNPETQNGPGCISKNTGSEMSSTSPHRHHANTPPSKDDVLSVVIEKLTELVNDSERMQGGSTPSVCRESKRMGSPKRGDPLYKCPKCPCLFALSAKQLQSKAAVLCECCENAEKLKECKGKTVKGQLTGLPTFTSADETKVNCELCSHVAVGYVDLLYHLLSKHKDAKICKCKFCDFFTTIEMRIQEHATVHHAPRVYRCSICPFVADKVVGLRQHMKDHDMHRELVLKCSECGFSCQCEDILRNHMWEHIPSISKTSAKTRKSNSTGMIPTSNPGRNSDEMSQPVLSPSLPTQTTDIEQPYIFKCLLCGYLCDRLATLKAHAWRHAGEKGCSYPVVDDDEYLKRNFSSAPSQTSPSGKSYPLEASSSIKAAETARESTAYMYDGVRGTDDTNEKEVLAEHESNMSHGCCCGPTHSSDESSSCRCEGINILPSSVSHIKELLLQKNQQKLSQKSNKANDAGKKPFATEQYRQPTSEKENQSECPSAPRQNTSSSKTCEFQASDGVNTVRCGNLAENGKPALEKGSKSNELEPQVLVIDPVDPLMLFLDLDVSIPEPAAVVEAVTEQNSALPHQEQLETTDDVFIPPSNRTRESVGTADRPESYTKVSAADLSSEILLSSMPLYEEVTEATAQYAENDGKCPQKCESEVPQQGFEENSKNLTIPQAANTWRRDDTPNSCDEIKDDEKNLGVTPGQVESVPSFLETSSPSECGHFFHQPYQGQESVSSSVKPQENPTKHLMKSGSRLMHIDMDLTETVVEHAIKQTPPRSQNPAKSTLCESEQMSCQESIQAITCETVSQSKWKEGSIINPGSSDHGSTDGSLQIAQQCERIEEKQLNNNTEIEPLSGGQKRGADLTASDMSNGAKRICHHEEKSNAEMPLPIIKEGLCTESTTDGQGRPVSDPETKLGRNEMPSDISSDEDSIVNFFMNVVSGCDKPYQCKLCSKTSETYSSLKQHLKVHLVHNSFRCPLCKECFESLDNLRLHILEHYKELHRCSECSAFFQTKNELHVHRQSHASLKVPKCEECGITMLTWADYDSHCETVHGNLGKPPVRCSHCGEGFINTNTLLLHTLSCPVRKIRSCKECGFTSESAEGVQDHVKECHHKPKFYKCNLCDYKSSAKNGIKNHMKFHSKDRPYKCQQCSFTGAYPQSLRSHMRMHMQPDWRPDCLSSELPEQYKCKLCCYTCNYLPSLKSHMWRHASDPNYSYKGNQNIITDTATTSNSSSTSTTVSDTCTTPPISTPAFQGPNERSGVMHNLVTFCCQDCGFQSTDRAQLVEHLKTHLPSEILETERKQS
ncbi:uncharacterized protein LOC119744773 [Patiria miniata]|uniref:C2H2-type domain-containing protein n=1 Tax=Patiria miniata TaxID=46514 RepID=A0A914BLN1_PATMI|nr:uncharacterized protein LOC119744773 [Patiria miniata]